MSLEVDAMLSKVIYQAEGGGFAVCEFIDSKSVKRFRASGKILTVGKTDAQQKYRLFGDWENNPRYGNTFNVIYSEPHRPDSIAGIVPFLVNNIKGVGEITAKKFLEKMDVRNIDALLTICKESPQKVFEFFKNKRNTAQSVISVLTGDEVYRNIMVFLHENNISTLFAQRIYDRYGSDALRLLTENPYRLISDFRNVGFLKADAIALKIGIPPTSQLRLEASFIFTLQMAASDGHCCLPRDILVEKASDILGGKQNSEFSFDFVLQQLRLIYKKNKDEKTEKFELRMPSAGHRSEMLFYLPDIFQLENQVAELCLTLLRNQNIGKEFKESEFLKSPSRLPKLVPTIPWDRLSDEQGAAVECSIGSRFMILTGGPGCGKTFVLKAIYQVQNALKRRVALAAPTGLAAKRMSVSIEAQAFTLHKMLRIGSREDLKNGIPGSGEDPLENVDVVIVDESSMLSLDLFHTLLEALGPHRRLILVGDQDQLPSIGAGNCLRDLISSTKVPLVRLTKIFRQSSESPIPLAAREIINGRRPEYSFKSFNHSFAQPESFANIGCKAEGFFDVLVPFLKETLPNIYGIDPVRDCQILVPMRRGLVGQENINKILQNELNPQAEHKQECAHGLGILREGDKVIQTRNNYDKDVFNGDLGFCRSIKITKNKKEIEIAFDEKIVQLEDEEADDLQLCYAMTIHKSQGSEFPLCIIPMFNAYFSMLDRNLLYTAVTRASKYAVLFGDDWAVKKAISSQQAVQRFTSLASLIREGCADLSLTK